MLEVVPVQKDRKEVLRNLLEKYNYEFSQWDQLDVNDLGLYDYDYLDCYWTDPNRWAYFLLWDGKLAGFAMVNDHPDDPAVPTDYSLAEFCVMPKYRRKGIGREAAYRVFDLHRGRWQLKRHPHNLPSVHFWDEVVSGYTHGRYDAVLRHPGIDYDDGTHADVLYFDNSSKSE